MTFRRFLTGSVAALAAMAPAMLSIACGGEKQAEPKTAENASENASRANPNLPEQAPESPTASAVRISDEIKQACGIADHDAYFAFDSAALKPEYTKTLDQVAACFTTGPLAGKTVRLVGHADPRGTADYNMTLGQSRADAVQKYLATKMDKSKTESTSRGAMDAAGTDEPSWARDRRVDVMLAQ